MEQASAEDVKRMVQEIGTTLQRTLSESPQIAHCLNRIRAEGYEVSLVLEATIGFSKTGGKDGPTEVSSFDVRVERTEPAPLTSPSAPALPRCAAAGCTSPPGRSGRRSRS